MIRRTFLALTTAAALAMPAYAQDMDIVDTAVANGSFTTLATALTPWRDALLRFDGGVPAR